MDQLSRRPKLVNTGCGDGYDAAPIFGPYLQGLVLLSKTDLHLSVENAARDAFLNALRRAMLSFRDWDGDDNRLIVALHRVIEPIIPDKTDRNRLFEGIEAKSTIDGTLSDAVAVKRVADVYLAIVARRRWAELVKRPRGNQGASPDR